MTAYRPRYLSHSAIDLYATCPAAYARRYVQRIADPPTPAMAFGRCFAIALEALHRGQDGEVAWVQAYVAAQQAGALPPGSPSVQHGLALLDLYRQRGIGQGTPEWRFELYLPNREAVPVPIVGYLDLATPTEIWEFKSSAARWDQGRVDGSQQAAVYRWAYQQLQGRKPDCVRFLVFSTRTVALQELCTYPAGPELQLFELRAAAVWRGIRDGRYPPRCGKPWCVACTTAAADGTTPAAPAAWTLRGAQ